MKRLAAVLLDTAARLGDDGGYVGSTACSTAVFGQRRNRRRRRRKTTRRGGMDCGGCGGSPGARRRHGGAWKALGVEVSSPASSVAFHRAAWRRGRWKKTPLPLVGRVGWRGRLRLGDR